MTTIDKIHKFLYSLNVLCWIDSLNTIEIDSIYVKWFVCVCGFFGFLSETDNNDKICCIEFGGGKYKWLISGLNEFKQRKKQSVHNILIAICNPIFASGSFSISPDFCFVFVFSFLRGTIRFMLVIGWCVKINNIYSTTNWFG